MRKYPGWVDERNEDDEFDGDVRGFFRKAVESVVANNIPGVGRWWGAVAGAYNMHEEDNEAFYQEPNQRKFWDGEEEDGSSF